MHCKYFEKLILESSERCLPPARFRELEEHVSRCSRCESFRDQLEQIRSSLRNSTAPASPPIELQERTRRNCIRAILHPEKIEEIPFKEPVPKWIWGALSILILLTAAVMFPVVNDYINEKVLNFPSAAVLTLILQNAAMLVFAPILLRWYRKRSRHYEVSQGN